MPTRFLVLALALTSGLPAVADGGKPDPQALRAAALTRRGEPGRGKLLFAGDRCRCAACHKVNGAGGDVGPDLSVVGGKFDRPHLIESVLEPSRQIVEGYRTTTVTTLDGRSFSGVVKEETAARLVLADANGKFAVAKADIDSRK